MKLNNVLTESEITELGLAGVAKGVAAAGRGLAKGAGALGRGAARVGKKAADLGRNAASSYRAGRQMNVGKTHAANIIKNLSQEYLRMVGGGEQPTLDSLKSYLSTVGLSDLDQLDQLVANLPQATSSNPNSLLSQGAALLKNKDIQNLIKKAVAVNYARIRAAQQGRAQPSGQQQQPVAPQQSQTAASPAANPFNNSKELAKAWAAYVQGGGKINKNIKKLIAQMNADANRPAAPAQPVPEAALHSKFLNINL